MTQTQAQAQKENIQIEKVMLDLGINQHEISPSDKTQQAQVNENETIQMYKEHLSLLIARGKTKEFVGKIITFNDLDNMSSKDLEKYYRIYEAAQASRINQSVTNGIINAYTQICGMIIKPEPKQLEKMNSDLKNDYLVRDQLEQWTSYLSFKMGPFMPLLSAAMITFENLYTINGESRSETRSETRNETRNETRSETRSETSASAKTRNETTNNETKDTETD